MQEKKILNEFAAKISKAKILYDNTSAACQKLRREANQLEKQYQQLVKERKAAQQIQQALHKREEMLAMNSKIESQKCAKEAKYLNELRNQKKEMKRQRDIAESQLLKNTLMLQDLVKQREQLQATAKSLSDKLEGVTSEKDVLLGQHQKTQKAIGKYSKNIEELQLQIEEMKNMIQINTVPVHHANGSRHA